MDRVWTAVTHRPVTPRVRRVIRVVEAVVMSILIIAAFAGFTYTWIARGEERKHEVRVLCRAINDGRDYDRSRAHNTLVQTEHDAHLIHKALEGKTELTAQDVTFLRRYLSSVVALERSNPKLLNLNPYIQPNLNCPALIKEAAE